MIAVLSTVTTTTPIDSLPVWFTIPVALVLWSVVLWQWAHGE